MSSQDVTLRQVFSLPENGAQDSSPDRWKSFQTKLRSELKTIKWSASMPDLVEKVGELFDVKLPDLFMLSWRKVDDLKRALDESRKTPEAIKDVGLMEHSITSEHRPYIEVSVRDVVVKQIVFVVRLTFRLKGFVLMIRAGEVEEIKTGRCEVEGTVMYEGLTLLEKKLSPIALPALLRFKHEEISHVYQRERAASKVVTV